MPSVSLRPSPVVYDQEQAQYTLDPGEELSLYSVIGGGSVTILFDGNGDGNLNIRVYTDGRLDDNIPTSEKRIGPYGFASSLRIVIRNPGTEQRTATGTTFKVRGIAWTG